MGIHVQGRIGTIFVGLIVGLLVLHEVSAGPTTATSIIEWQTGGPLVRLGPSYAEQPFFSTYVFAPEAVAQAARKVVGGDPATWRIDHTLNFLREEREGRGEEEVYGADEQHETVTIQDFQDGWGGKRFFVCLIQKEHWKRLNTPQSLPYLSEVMGSTLKLPRDQHDNERLAEFVQDVAYLSKPEVGLEILSEGTFRAKEFIHSISGPDKDAADFRSLCVDPTVTLNHGIWTVVMNAVTINQGAVQTWTLTMRSGERTEITGIQIQEIRPPKSFYCGGF